MDAPLDKSVALVSLIEESDALKFVMNLFLIGFCESFKFYILIFF